MEHNICVDLALLVLESRLFIVLGALCFEYLTMIAYDGWSRRSLDSNGVLSMKGLWHATALCLQGQWLCQSPSEQSTPFTRALVEN